MCLVSIIIPCYNSSKSLDKCLQSLVNQKNKDFEVIFVDDCSTDSTLDVLNKFKISSGLQVAVKKMEKNSGPGAARNEGIKQAKGKYLCFCDSDDWYSDDFIDEMLHAVEDDVDVALCNISLVNNEGELTSYTKIDSNVSTINELIAFNDGSLCNLIFKKEILNGLTLPSEYHGEDMAFVPIVISRSKTFKYVNKDLYFYKVNNGSLSSKVSQKECYSLLNAFSFIENNMDSNLRDEIEYNGIKIVVYAFTLTAIKAGLNIKDIKKEIKNFESKYPKWYKNKYIAQTSFKKRVYFKCIRRRLWPLNKIYAKLHEKLLRENGES